ncbi:DNA polymerase III beta subunit family protein [Bacillus sp. 491mf]|uniref:DNA polymerase III subunit beta n=1 Tax=Bacillus sp. 491mf TaxID=1761755 RepID=UPI0008E45C31|nr:DNA polymerase III subunit beta [Bacillus sp. 491mf]SFD50587.1 DNA polymerase III beta subunit family protein [Bacillus sp. 491mf]
MEFIINNECFNKAISDVSKAISNKTPLPILSGIKIIADKNGLTLIGSNSDILIERFIPSAIEGVNVLEVYNAGSVVVSAKYFGEIVKKLPNDIRITVKDNHLVTIQSDDIVTNLNGFNPEEYPNLPDFNYDINIKIPSHQLTEVIKQTVFAVAKSESRPILTGVNMKFTQNKLICVATDSHRLALREINIESNVKGSFVVPKTSLNELIKLIGDYTDLINIFVAENYIVFKTDTVSLFSRLIAGSYPNTAVLIPKDFKTVITLYTKQFLQGIDRASLFASEWKNNNVNLEVIDGSKIKISSNSSEIGKISETQSVKTINGQMELSISLDGSFMIDALKVIKEDEIKLSFGGSMRPVLIEPINNPSQLNLISPVRSY